jgi:hypothetical protein
LTGPKHSWWLRKKPVYVPSQLCVDSEVFKFPASSTSAVHFTFGHCDA